jgi:SAM-dependent methyltransferase
LGHSPDKVQAIWLQLERLYAFVKIFQRHQRFLIWVVEQAEALQLAELTQGSILAVDIHAPSIEKLNQKLSQLGLMERIRSQVGDMRELALAESSFDLIWSEGAFYNIGIQQALSISAGLLRKGGYLVFSDAIWCKANLPDVVKAIFESDYPAMGSVADLVALIERSPFELLDHFPLPPEAW